MKAKLTIKEIPNTKYVWIQDFMPNTKYVWIQDFMPIKNTNNEWLLFKYFPKYLKNPKFRSLICDNQNICKELGIEYSYINLILDGGSEVYQDDLYFVSERILSDNYRLSKT